MCAVMRFSDVFKDFQVRSEMYESDLLNHFNQMCRKFEQSLI